MGCMQQQWPVMRAATGCQNSATLICAGLHLFGSCAGRNCSLLQQLLLLQVAAAPALQAQQAHVAAGFC